ncbi:MAG: FtsX-like permease family protein [Candidatus Dojkabacteria bacterium]|jgi:ABC-type antimicrobial peptide transport system permease subunit|nr:ABC transporter permease [Candidatus Dojkabacteria bacterium]
MRNKTKFFIEKTKASLKELGIVAVIISLSIMFSSLCVMSLISLSDGLANSLNGNPKSRFGAEVKVYSSSQNFENIEKKLQEMHKEGIVEKYSFLSAVPQQYVLYSQKTYGQDYINVLGYENNSYPMEGVMEFKSGRDDMSELLTNGRGIVISERLAEKNELKIGDKVTLVSTDLFSMETFEIVDMITKDYRGSIPSVFINGSRLREFEVISAYIFYVDGDQQKIAEEVIKVDDGTTVKTLEIFIEESEAKHRSYILFIRGLSVLGLFIGSFGIASAIKVIINKRKRELGILKVVGFLERDITKMLLIEVSLISLIGSIAGVCLGHAFFSYLVKVLSSDYGVEFVINSDFNLSAAILALFVSIISSVLFAYISIKQTSEIKPIYAIKNQDYVGNREDKKRNILRFFVIGLIFSGISIFLAKSVVYGIGAVALVTIGILLFSLIFKLIFSLILKIPVKTHNEVELTWINLRLNYKKIIVPMIAIFIGVTTVNLINTLVYSTNQMYSDQYTDIEADINVVIDRVNPSDNEVENSLKETEGVDNYTLLYKTSLKHEDEYFYGDLVGLDVSEMKDFLNVLEGEQKKYGVLIDSYEKVRGDYVLGDAIKVNGVNIEITGVFEINYDFLNRSLVRLIPCYIVSKEEFKMNFKEDFIEEVWISVDRNNIDLVLSDISDISDIFVTSSKQYEEMFNSAINILIKFSTSIASLALLAGIILIITVTVLDVVSRRKTFAIYKTIGFKQNKISKMVLLEYGLMTLITSSFATLLVYLFSLFMNAFGEQLFQIEEEIIFDLKGSLIWDIGLLGLVLFLVYLVSRKTLKVKPVEMLRYE